MFWLNCRKTNRLRNEKKNASVSSARLVSNHFEQSKSAMGAYRVREREKERDKQVVRLVPSTLFRVSS